MSHVVILLWMSHIQSSGNLTPSLPLTQELLAFESIGAFECLGDEFDKSARFQKPTIVNEIEQRERDRIPKKTRQRYSSGTVGFHSSKPTSYALFYYNCKGFGFRAMNDHVNLMAEQYEFGANKEGGFVIFNGRISTWPSAAES